MNFKLTVPSLAHNTPCLLHATHIDGADLEIDLSVNTRNKNSATSWWVFWNDSLSTTNTIPLNNTISNWELTKIIEEIESNLAKSLNFSRNLYRIDSCPGRSYNFNSASFCTKWLKQNWEKTIKFFFFSVWCNKIYLQILTKIVESNLRCCGSIRCCVFNEWCLCVSTFSINQLY